jgi:hypothetical protein
VNGGRRGVTSRKVECFPRTEVLGAHRFVKGRKGLVLLMGRLLGKMGEVETFEKSVPHVACTVMHMNSCCTC